VGDGVSPELILAGNLERYGQALLAGRPLSANEVYCMNVARRVVEAYQMRTNADNWAQWARDNPELVKLLAEAETLANG
jgi:enoyl-CoA hydratase/carnithine racemase